MEFAQYIQLNPEIRFGKPTIKGTRIAISDILQWLASGMSNDEILEDYPQLKLEHIHAALAFAANREQMIKMVAARNEIVTH
jgi:uncharacterized protein (DUF433 family)